MRKLVTLLFLLIGLTAAFLFFRPAVCPLLRPQPALRQDMQPVRKELPAVSRPVDLSAYRDNFLNLLKLRKDSAALKEIERALFLDPDDATALWAKAEVLRRGYRFAESEKLLNLVLSKYPGHTSCLISLSYIRYHDSRFEEALSLLKQVLNQPDLSRENKGLSYMLIGSINAKKASLGGFFSKIAYGTRIRGYFEKAKRLAPDLSEAYLGLGTFYLLAPRIVGGDIDKAIGELETAVKLTPEFATVNARLAQAYKKKGGSGKYNFYFQRAKELDPDNEVLRELEASK